MQTEDQRQTMCRAAAKHHLNDSLDKLKLAAKLIARCDMIGDEDELFKDLIHVITELKPIVNKMTNNEANHKMYPED